MFVDIEMLTDCGVVGAGMAGGAGGAAGAAGAAGAGGVGLDTRIQQRAPRFSPLAPSTPACNGNGCGRLLLLFITSEFITSERKMLASMYSLPLRGMKRSKPESGVAAVEIFWLWSLIFCLYRVVHSGSS